MEMTPDQIKKLLNTPIPVLIKRAQIACNRYINLRDQGRMCISCNRNPANQAGHFIPIANNTYVRFHEHNLNGQCGFCNLRKYGNVVYYRQGLVRKIGEEKVKELEELACQYRTYSYGRMELVEIIKNYNKKYNELKKSRN